MWSHNDDVFMQNETPIVWLSLLAITLEKKTKNKQLGRVRVLWGEGAEVLCGVLIAFIDQ